MLKVMVTSGLLLLQVGMLAAPAACVLVQRASTHECETPASGPAAAVTAQASVPGTSCFSATLCLRPSIAPIVARLLLAQSSIHYAGVPNTVSDAPGDESRTPPFHPPRV